MAAEVGDSGSRRWKLRWQPQAAHVSEVGSVAVEEGDGMNSPQPSTAWPPIAAAWFFMQSLYATAMGGGGGWWWCLSAPPLMKDKGLIVCGGVSISVSSGLLVEGGVGVKSMSIGIWRRDFKKNVHKYLGVRVPK